MRTRRYTRGESKIKLRTWPGLSRLTSYLICSQQWWLFWLQSLIESAGASAAWLMLTFLWFSPLYGKCSCRYPWRIFSTFCDWIFPIFSMVDQAQTPCLLRSRWPTMPAGSHQPAASLELVKLYSKICGGHPVSGFWGTARHKGAAGAYIFCSPQRLSVGLRNVFFTGGVQDPKRSGF